MENDRMTVRNRQGIKTFELLIFVLLFAVTIYHPVVGLKVIGSKAMVDVAPGSTATHTMTISISSTESEMDIQLDVMGFNQSTDFIYRPVTPPQDTSPYSARQFITLDKKVVHLDPGSFVDAVATIKIPPNVGSGGRYAIITITGGPVGGGATGFATAINVPVLITIAGPGLVETGKITGIGVSEAIVGEPMKVYTTLMNTGNHHYYDAVNEVIIKNSNGSIVFNTSTPPSAYAIIPSQTVIFTTYLYHALPIGNYTVISKISIVGKLLDEGNSTFTIKKAYMPPFQEISKMVPSQNPSVLTSIDGIVSISFPQGAILDDTIVIIKPVPQSVFSPPAPGTKFGVTGLSIEGITGLLLKPATIVLKYNPDDLVAANGDASKLFLARWDKTENQWILIPTKVDTTAGTLTVTTNRLSLWAVMVSEGVMPTETAAEGTKVEGFTLGIACGALVILVIKNRIRRQ